MKSCSVVSLSLSFFFIRIFSTEAAPQCLYHDCPNTTLFTPNSTHQPNLPTLPSFLSSATTHTTDGFTIATTGQNPPDLAYRSGKKVTVAEANFTLSCALAQCTQDFTASDCVTCLQIGVANVSEWKQDGRLPTSSCSLRYELYPIYNASALPSPVPPPAAPVTGPEAKSNKSSVIIIGVALSVGPTVVFLFLAWCFSWRNATMTRAVVLGDQIGINNITNSESLRYDLATIRATTDNFSHQNKLGVGRFGRVYKGMLPSGQLTAVKRLSRSSRQGVEEFKNEVMLLPKLQHQNLVQLLGFCLEGEEKLLVYEFVPNQSLDYFLFDSEKNRQLDWSTRYKIACGIAGGLLYLHEDSRLRIIHGDLKPSNILLDSKMNPKISDFSMARVFGVDQIDAYPIRIARNRVYISPEFEMRGQISVKSDIYNFGVLLLELITGKPNSFSNQADGGESIASYAWKNWRDGTPLAVLDPAIGETYSRDEILRCLKIGLLCAQKDPDDRPTMADIVLEISSHPVVPVELPQQPAFFLSRTERPMEELKTDQSIHGG